VQGDVKLIALIEPVVKALGLRLWGIEMVAHGRHKTLRIYIDSDQGIELKDCESVSHQISSMLDVEEPITGNYTLEVSSPGLDRSLFNAEQFGQYLGHTVQIKLRHSFDGRRNYKGILNKVEDQEVGLIVDEHEYVLPIESIEKAKIVPRF